MKWAAFSFPRGFVEALRGSLLSRSLASAPFVGLLLAYALTQFSEGMTQTALTWIAFRIRHNDVTLVGRIGLLQTIIPFLILIPAGVLIDLLPRQIFMAAINLFKGSTYAIIPILSLFEPLRTPSLLVIVVVTALLSSGFGPAFNAAIPGFVPYDRLKHANGWIQIAGQGGYFLGPLVTAGLLLYFPAPWLLGISGGGFVLSAFLFALIPPPLDPLESRRSEGKGRDHAVSSRSDGLHHKGVVSGFFHSAGLLLGNPVLLLCTFLLMVFALFNAPMSMVFPLLSSQVFQTPPSFYALLSGAYFLGSFLGGTLLLGRRLPGYFSLISGGMLLASGAFLLLPRLTWPSAGLFLLLIIGTGLSWAQPLAYARIQQIVPSRTLGRLLAVVMTLFLLSALVGIEGGTVFLHRHPVSTFLHIEGGFLLSVSVLVLLLVTLFRSRLS